MKQLLERKHGTRTIVFALLLTMLAWLAPMNIGVAKAADDTVYQRIGNCNIRFNKSTGAIEKCEFLSSGQGVCALTIPETIGGVDVRRIGNRSFASASWLKSLRLPDSVTDIEDAAFYNCSFLNSVTFSNNLQNIGPMAFSACRGLTNLDIPSSVEIIDQSAFSHCTELRKVDLPEGVKTIGMEAFSWCDNLSEAVIPNSVKAIGGNAFRESAAGFVIKGYDGSEAELYAKSNSIDFVSLGGTIPSIHGVEINNENFPDDNFREIVKSYDYDEDGRLSPEELQSVDEMRINNCGIGDLTGIECFTALEILDCGGNQLSGLDVSGNTALIRLDCSGNLLNSLDISNNTALEWLDCSGNFLDGLDISNNPELVDVTYDPQKKGPQTISVPQDVYNKNIGDGAFSLGVRLTIGDGELIYTSSNEKVATVSPNGIVTIQGIGAANIVIQATETENYAATEKTIRLTVSKKREEQPVVENPVINQKPGTPIKEDVSSLVQLKVGSVVKDKKSNGAYVVTQAKNTGGTVTYKKPMDKKKTSVTIPATVNLSGKAYKVTTIEKNAFKGNKKLKSVKIGANVRDIRTNAFASCKNLKSITIQTKKLTKKTIGAGAFKGVNAKATVKVPKGKAKAYKKLLRSKGLSKKAKVR